MTDVLVRRKVRQAALAALQALPDVTVESPGDWAVQPKDLPNVKVRASGDRKVATQRGLPTFTTSVSLELLLTVSSATGEGAQDAVEALGHQVESALYTDFDLVRMVQAFQTAQSAVEVDSTGAAHVGRCRMVVECETYEEFQPDLQGLPTFNQLNLHIDMASVYDASGTYTGAPFPDAVLPAPRTSGPDGRDEGAQQLDMTTNRLYSDAAIVVDLSAPIAPLRTGMVGIRSNSVADEFLPSLSQMAPIGPAAICVGIEFDAPIGENENPPWSPAVSWDDPDAPTSATPDATEWLLSVEGTADAADALPVLQCAGAPLQYADTIAVKPAAHPAPVDMAGYITWQQAFWDVGNHARPVVAIVNNEPGHSLEKFDITKNRQGQVILPDETPEQYTPRIKAANDLAVVEQAQMLIGAAKADASHWTTFGLGSFITADFNLKNDKGTTDGRTFFDAAIDTYLAQQTASPGRAAGAIGFNCFNDHFTDIIDILNGWGSRNGPLNLPAIVTQKGQSTTRRAPGTDPMVGSVEMLTDLMTLHGAAVQHVCQSYWCNANFAFVNGAGSSWTRTPLWHALYLFTRIPPRRVRISKVTAPDSTRDHVGVHAIAGHHPGLCRLLLWNDAETGSETYQLAVLNLPADLGGVTPTITAIGLGMSAPVVTTGRPETIEVPAGSVMLVEWRAAGAEDRMTRRKPMGSGAKFLSAPMQCDVLGGGWGHVDQVRGVATIQSQGQSSMSARIAYASAPASISIEPWVFNGTAGSLEVILAFTGGPTVTAYSQALTSLTNGAPTTLNLNTLGGETWAAGERELLITFRLTGTTAGTSAEVWYRAI